VLTDKTEDRLKEIVKEMAPFHDWIICEINCDQDHLHTFLSAPPRFSPAEIIKLIKTWTQKHIFKEFPKIKTYLWGGKLWCEGYYVSTVNDRTTAEEIKRYIQDQKKQLDQLTLWNHGKVERIKNPRASVLGVV
jgi:putative transposase